MKHSVEFEKVKRHKLLNQDGVYQLPLVVLLCEFARPSASKGATVLEWHDVMTLFHELVHAMHCELSTFLYDENLTMTNVHFTSHDRSYRIPERLWNTLRDRFC